MPVFAAELSGSTLARLSIRIDLDGGLRIGPGKIRLLELIEATGSISAAGRAMAMSYRRAWLLVESLNTSFREPVVAAQSGGRHGGGARLTPFGHDLVVCYRAIEARSRRGRGSPSRGASKPPRRPAGTRARLGVISDWEARAAEHKQPGKSCRASTEVCITVADKRSPRIDPRWHGS